MTIIKRELLGKTYGYIKRGRILCPTCSQDHTGDRLVDEEAKGKACDQCGRFLR